jgi:hypothetical protein
MTDVARLFPEVSATEETKGRNIEVPAGRAEAA